MWSDDDIKRFEYLEKMTPEEHELRKKSLETKFLKFRLKSLQTEVLAIKSTAWTDEARKFCLAIADHAADAIKSLDDQIKILELKIKALEAQND